MLASIPAHLRRALSSYICILSCCGHGPFILARERKKKVLLRNRSLKSPWVFLSHLVIIFKKRRCCSVFKCILGGLSSTRGLPTSFHSIREKADNPTTTLSGWLSALQMSGKFMYMFQIWMWTRISKLANDLNFDVLQRILTSCNSHNHVSITAVNDLFGFEIDRQNKTGTSGKNCDWTCSKQRVAFRKYLFYIERCLAQGFLTFLTLGPNFFGTKWPGSKYKY